MTTTEIHLPYGHSRVVVNVPSRNLLGVFEPKKADVSSDVPAMLLQALEKPIGTPRLSEIAKCGQKVAIVTSDFSRPCPSDQLIPPILAELNKSGVPDEDIFVAIALGLHRPMTESEIEAMVGAEVYNRVRVVNHDLNNTVRIGVTSAGTPVEFFRPLVEADLRVCLGNLEFHYFAGYSGGAKAILPGCGSKATLNANHSMMVRPEATTGRVEGNPVRADIEEGVCLLGVDFIFNVLVDGDHNIIGAVAGHVIEAHRKGCDIVARRGKVEIPEQAQIVLVSAGGHPKDCDLYQAQKALDNALHAVKKDGIIILVAKCEEGFGNDVLEEWMGPARMPDELLEKIQQEFVLGGHKAAAIAAVLKRANVYLVSTLPSNSIQCWGISLFEDVSTAVQAAFDTLGGSASMLALPFGGSVLPEVASYLAGC